MRRFTILCLALVIGGSAAAIAGDPPGQLAPDKIQTIRKNPNAATNARRIAEGLQDVGFADVQNTKCSGTICNSEARWEGRPVQLRIELRTGRVQTTELR